MTAQRHATPHTPPPGHPTMKLHPSLATLGLAAALLSSAPATAADDHGHDHGNASPAATGTALPRFAAVSEIFELVGVLDGKQITLYLDRFADNTPVPNAEIELEIGGAKFKAQAAQGREAAAEYEVVLAEAPKPGVLPITATVTAGGEVDLLAGELDLHEEAHAHEAAHTHSWKEYAGWAAGAIAALALLLVVGRRWMASRPLRAGGAA